MKKVNLYFDFVKKQGQVILGAVMYERGKSIRHEFKKVKRLSGEESSKYNQFHSTIKALSLGIEGLREWIKKERVGNVDVLLMNQNELVFKWLAEQSYDLSYKELFNELEYRLMEVLDYTEFGFVVIQGKENKAKKMLKTESPDDSFIYRKLDFKGLRGRLGKQKQKRKASGGNNIVSIEKFRL